MKTPTLEELTNKTFPQLQSGDMSQAVYHDGYSYTNIDDDELKAYGKACFELGQQQKAEEIEKVIIDVEEMGYDCECEYCDEGSMVITNTVSMLQALTGKEEKAPAPLSVEKEI